MNARALFITATDTGAGKSHVTAGLLRAFGRAGHRALGMKPIASGATELDGERVNEDVEALCAASNVVVPKRVLNPYLFTLPASPHLAAAAEGAAIDLSTVSAAFARCRAAADIVLVEGVGGWCVPLGERLWVADLPRALALRSVLVVGVKLGCINHALLTARAMMADGQPPLAWVANILDPELPALAEVLATLERELPAPLAGVIGYGDPQARGAGFDALALGLEGLARSAGHGAW